MFETRDDGIYYQTGTGADDWAKVARAQVLDAGDNVIEDAPAADWERLETHYAKPLREGRYYLVGV